MVNKKTQFNPFSLDFLTTFILTPETTSFKNDEIIQLDKTLTEYEQVFMDPDVEKYLISKNEILASFAISKAENSSLTLAEAQEVYQSILDNEDYVFIQKKISAKRKLTIKDYEKLEFYNIAKTFRALNQQSLNIQTLASTDIQKMHQQLTQVMDIFHGILPEFTPYKSGKWRDNDEIRVGSYIPAPYTIIPKGIEELLTWLKKNPTPTGIAVFHTALYALHPFNNGNKRVCRILEHLLLRSIGLNTKNLYSTSYYYHKQKERYYKYLLYSLERRNLNHFTGFVLEALALSMISVIKTSLESKRSSFLQGATDDNKIRTLLKPLIKRRELQFKVLYKMGKKIGARQTFVTYLQKAVDAEIVRRRVAGRNVYYELNIDVPEYSVFTEWRAFAQKRLTYIPDDIRLS